MPGNVLYIWTREQYEFAAQWFGEAYGWMPLPTLQGAARVIDGWWARNDADPPGGALLVDESGRGVRGQLATRWAILLFRHAAFEARVLPFKSAYF